MRQAMTVWTIKLIIALGFFGGAKLKKIGLEPAFGQLGLGGSLLGYSSHGHSSNGNTCHASLRAYGAQVEGYRLYFKRPLPL